MWQQSRIEVRTRGRGFHELTQEVRSRTRESGLSIGSCHLFLRHTSASLCLTENADADVRSDLERFAQHLVRDGDPLFRHDAEGPDDMPAHIRNLLFGFELTLPICEAELALGSWQGIYLWEHRHAPMQRELIVTLNGQS